MSEVLHADEAGIERAAAALRGGKLVGMPTETVYGLAARFDDEAAVLGIFAAKERPRFDPLIVHLAPEGLADGTFESLIERDRLSPAAANALSQLIGLWPAPLTLVLPKSARVLDVITSGLDTVAVRVPRHPVAQALLRRSGPVAAPSANRFGRISPTDAEHVVRELGEHVALVLDGGSCEEGVESTILGIEDDGTLRLLRPGAVALEALPPECGEVRRPAPAKSQPAAPGMLASHYAPRKPLALWEPHSTPAAPFGVLAFDHHGATRAASLPVRPASVVTLSEEGDLAEAAQNLFRALRALDADPAIDRILAERCPTDAGLGLAINDRLRRAAADRE